MNTTSHGLTNYFLLRHRKHAALAAAAGLLPDMPYLLAGLVGVVRHGISESALLSIWGNPVANFAAQRVFQSVVLVTAVSAIALLSRDGRLRAFAAGWSLHVWTDHWLHSRDAYPTLWPLSRRVFPSPVSYWDWDFHGRWAGVALAIGSIALWLWLARRFVRGQAGGALLAARGRWISAAVAVLFALLSLPTIGFAVAGIGPRTGPPAAWVDDGFACWPPPVAPAVEALPADPDGALAILASLPDGADTAPCPGAPSWDRPVAGARIALLSGYAHDLAGRRSEAVAHYRKAERLETVGALGDKARRYQGEPFRNVPDPFVTPEWVAIFFWGLALCVVMVRSVPLR